LQARGEPIAHALQLAEVEQHRSASGGAGDRGGRGNEGEPFSHDRRARTLEPRNLRPQRRPCGALVELLAKSILRPRAAPTASARIDQRLTALRSIDELLLAVGHTHLLSGRARFYQRARAR
jgi:hypothetical protein